VGLYRIRDLVNTPSLISLSRIPLAIAFVWLVDQPLAALVVLILAGLSDVLDGWIARRTGSATATGAAVDPITDKLFVLTVVVTLIAVGKLSAFDMLLLSTREIGELPLVVGLALSRRARRRKRDYPRANLPGKLATTLQFCAVVTVLFDWPIGDAMLFITAIAGVVAAVSYWARALRLLQQPEPQEST
jgi:CDP-diacylglycerol--glycerol-3-phosphate 3-phosphatidyltransferase/cardiolipin synthase